MKTNYVAHSSVTNLLFGLDENSVDLVFTDPPYDKGSIPLYGYLAASALHCLKPGGFVLAMAGGLHTNQHLELMSQHLNYYWTFHLIMGGNGSVVYPMGTMMPVVSRIKPIYAFVKGKGKPRTVVYDPFTGSGNEKAFHAWGQDAKSARYYIDCFTRAGDLVVDPFCGGGTYPLVCQALDRKWIAGDIDISAVETTRNRLRNPYYAPPVDNQLVLKFSE